MLLGTGGQTGIMANGSAERDYACDGEAGEAQEEGGPPGVPACHLSYYGTASSICTAYVCAENEEPPC